MIPLSGEKRNIVIFPLAFIIIGACLVKFYRYQINPDGISYISISEKYLNGQFIDAINGFWSPLLSFLLIPFLWLGVDALLSTKILGLITGVFTIIGTWLVSYRLVDDEKIRVTILITLVPVTLYFSLSVITPDLLATCILLYYYYMISGSTYTTNSSIGIWCGLLGATAYLSKSYSFPFFVSHFTLTNLFHYLRYKKAPCRKTILRNYGTGLVIFLLISGAWILLIAQKYGTVTIGLAGRYNHALMGPNSAGFFEGQPHYKKGLISPPNPSAVSIWEDPSFNQLESWDILESSTTFFYQLKVILRNAYNVFLIYQEFSALSIMFILVSIWFLCVRRQSEYFDKFQLDLLFGTFAIYPTGYLLFHVEDRYLWFSCIMIIIMGSFVVSHIFRVKSLNSFFKGTILVVFVVSLAINPIKHLRESWNSGKDIYMMSQVIKKASPKGNVASNGEWQRSSSLCYYLGLNYFGVPKKNIKQRQLEQELEVFKIDYLFVWDEGDKYESMVAQYRDILSGDIPTLIILPVGRSRADREGTSSAQVATPN